jgi:hypothetical protein
MRGLAHIISTLAPNFHLFSSHHIIYIIMHIYLVWLVNCQCGLLAPVQTTVGICIGLHYWILLQGNGASSNQNFYRQMC